MISFRQAILILILSFVILACFQYQENVNLSKELKASESAQEKSLNEIARLTGNLEETNAELKKTEQALDELNKSLAVAEEIIERLNYSEYRNARILGIRNGEGVATPIRTEVRSGAGDLMIDTTGVLLEEDTQRTMKTAYLLAQKLMEKNLSDKDVIFHMINPFNKTVTIGGGSAGAVMALSLIAILDNRSVREDVLVTGGIMLDGEITNVTYVREKAIAAKEANATVLLVPAGQETQIEGLEIVAVTDIREVMDYMLN